MMATVKNRKSSSNTCSSTSTSTSGGAGRIKTPTRHLLVTVLLYPRVKVESEGPRVRQHSTPSQGCRGLHYRMGFRPILEEEDTRLARPVDAKKEGRMPAMYTQAFSNEHNHCAFLLP